MINKKYTEWIDEKYPTPEKAKNKCNEAVRKMLCYFPELEIRVGWCEGIYHCWLFDCDKQMIIDPTFRQFKHPLNYIVIADRFLEKDEIELSTGAIFLKDEDCIECGGNKVIGYPPDGYED